MSLPPLFFNSIWLLVFAVPGIYRNPLILSLSKPVLSYTEGGNASLMQAY